GRRLVLPHGADARRTDRRRYGTAVHARSWATGCTVGRGRSGLPHRGRPYRSRPHRGTTRNPAGYGSRPHAAPAGSAVENTHDAAGPIHPGSAAMRTTLQMWLL